MRVVEVGQHFVTKDTGDFRQFRSVTCREYTLPRDDPASQPKGWIQGNMRIGPVLEVTTSFKTLHSWVRISNGTVKFVKIHKKSKFHKQAQVWLQPGQRLKQNLKREYSLGRQQPYQYMKEYGLTLSHQNKILPLMISRRKSLIHNQTLQREEDGAIEFYKIKFHLRNHHSQIHNWSDDRWKACLPAGGGSKRRYQYCSDNLGTILHLRALQGHSGNNLIDLMLQDNVVIGTGICPYINHVECTFNLHSIINNGLVPGGQNLSRRLLLAC